MDGVTHEHHDGSCRTRSSAEIGHDDRGPIPADTGGATGFTALHGVSGFGHHGHHGQHEGRLLFNDRNSLSLLISVVPVERAEPVVAGIRRLLDDQHGVVFISETHVSRPEYFQAPQQDDATVD